MPSAACGAPARLYDFDSMTHATTSACIVTQMAVQGLRREAVTAAHLCALAQRQRLPAGEHVWSALLIASL